MKTSARTEMDRNKVLNGGRKLRWRDKAKLFWSNLSKKNPPGGSFRIKAKGKAEVDLIKSFALQIQQRLQLESYASIRSEAFKSF